MKLKHNSGDTNCALLIQGADILLELLIVVSTPGHTTLDHMGNVAHGEFNCMYLLCTTELMFIFTTFICCLHVVFFIYTAGVKSV